MVFAFEIPAVCQLSTVEYSRKLMHLSGDNGSCTFSRNSNNYKNKDPARMQYSLYHCTPNMTIFLPVTPYTILFVYNAPLSLFIQSDAPSFYYFMYYLHSKFKSGLRSVLLGFEFTLVCTAVYEVGAFVHIKYF